MTQTGPFISSGTDTASLTRISLCHSGFKGVAISSVRGIVPFNDCRSYCLDSSTLTFLTNSPCSPVFSSSRGEITWKYKAIHEIAVNLDNLSSFFMSNTHSRYPSYPSQGYPSNANSPHKETKEV